MGLFPREESELDKKVKTFQLKELQKKKKTLLVERKAREVERGLKRDIRQLKTEKHFGGLINEGKKIIGGFHRMAGKSHSGSSHRQIDWGTGSNVSLGMGGLKESRAGHSLMAGMSGQGNHSLSFGREPSRNQKRQKTIIKRL